MWILQQLGDAVVDEIAWVLDGLRRAGVRPRKIRSGLDELKRQFGAEYVLMAPELATDGVEDNLPESLRLTSCG